MPRASDFLTAAQVAARLGVKKSTVYTYASRGWIETTVVGRTRRYRAADVDALRTRSDAAHGHDAAAAAAMAFGPPVLSTALSCIDAEGPYYRGQSAVSLAERGTSFEDVAVLLIGAPLGRRPRELGADTAALRALVTRGASVFQALTVVTAAQHGAARTEASSLLWRLAAGASLAVGGRRSWEERAQAALSAPSIAGALTCAVGGRSSAVGFVDGALVLCADHELNASSFAARVAAGTGADNAACVTAALAALSGPRHGGLCDRIEAWLLAPTASDAPLFRHPLYPDGDPRAELLLRWAATRRTKPATAIFRVLDDLRSLGSDPPVLDWGLVALCAAAGLPRGSASAIFAVGRAAGWIAHAVEQRATGKMIRPRATWSER